MNNFTLTDESIVNDSGITLHRIRCIRTFLHAKEGELGGFIQHEHNLYEQAWCADEAQIFESATVSGQALVKGCAKVFGSALISNNVIVGDASVITGDVELYGNLIIGGEIKIIDGTVVTPLFTEKPDRVVFNPKSVFIYDLGSWTKQITDIDPKLTGEDCLIGQKMADNADWYSLMGLYLVCSVEIDSYTYCLFGFDREGKRVDFAKVSDNPDWLKALLPTISFHLELNDRMCENKMLRHFSVKEMMQEIKRRKVRYHSIILPETMF